MNAKLLAPAEINALSTAGQREYAKAIGVKRAANDTKATLAAKLLNRTLEIEKARAAEREQIAAMKAKAKIRVMMETPARKGKGKCNVCHKRRAGNDAGLSQMCQPCADEGGWENTHNDDNHEALAADDPERDGCWICHPELNEAQQAEKAPRAGSSKAGMTVIAKGDKVAIVKAAIEAKGGDVHVRPYPNGDVRLTANIGDIAIVAQWNGRAFDYKASSFNGKKFRNVKELFRFLEI